MDNNYNKQNILKLFNNLDLNYTVKNINEYLTQCLKEHFRIKKTALFRYSYKKQLFSCLSGKDPDNIKEVHSYLSDCISKKEIIQHKKQAFFPLIYLNKPLAVWYMESTVKPVGFDWERIQFNIDLCALLYYNSNIYNIAVKDGLTRLYNIRYFHYCLEEAMQTARNNKKKLSLILIDIDHFKHYNDKYGHPAGDQILFHMARSLSGLIEHKQGICARYGGEEFIILLPDMANNQAYAVADNIRKQIRQMKVSNQDFFWKITISLGVATYPDDAADNMSLINVADQALYYSKKHGRNMVTTYQYAKNN